MQSSDLLQGGVEVPCVLNFRAIPKEILKLKECLTKKGRVTVTKKQGDTKDSIVHQL